MSNIANPTGPGSRVMPSRSGTRQVEGACVDAANKRSQLNMDRCGLRWPVAATKYAPTVRKSPHRHEYGLRMMAPRTTVLHTRLMSMAAPAKRSTARVIAGRRLVRATRARAQPDLVDTDCVRLQGHSAPRVTVQGGSCDHGSVLEAVRVKVIFDFPTRACSSEPACPAAG